MKVFSVISGGLYAIFLYFFGLYILQQKDKVSYFKTLQSEDIADNTVRGVKSIAKDTKYILENLPEYNSITFEYLKTLFSKLPTSIYVLLIYIFLNILISIIIAKRKNREDLEFYTSFLFNPQIIGMLIHFVIIGFVQDYYNSVKLNYGIEYKTDNGSEVVVVTKDDDDDNDDEDEEEEEEDDSNHQLVESG